MAERLNNKHLIVLPSKMTYKEYYMKFIRKNEANLANGWGWFVDIELNSEPVREIQNRSNVYNRYRLFPSLPTKTNPSIQSKKSVRNLQDTSMMFEMDEDNKEGRNDHNKKSRTNNYSLLFTNCIGVLAVAICYYISYR